MASFFVSRIDTLVDPLLEKLIAHGGKVADVAKKVRGQVAIASATMAYQIYKEIFLSEQFQNLADRHARVQRLLWASTTTKNPDYSDLKYVETLISPDTINTVTVETLAEALVGDATLVCDGENLGATTPPPIEGVAAVCRFLINKARAWMSSGASLQRTAIGEVPLLLAYCDGRLMNALAFVLRGRQVRTIYVINRHLPL